MHKINIEKAGILYDEIDRNKLEKIIEETLSKEEDNTFSEKAWTAQKGI